MKGFVPTPPHLVDLMVTKLFRDRAPRAGDSLLDPGCGTGAFIHGIVRWCHRFGHPIPRTVGIESDSLLLEEARRSLAQLDQITLLNEDFLVARQDRFDFVVGNPPYVPITDLTVEERTKYRRRYHSATGRFDLYLLFFEQALRLLKGEGRLVFITPEKYLYTQTAEPLRRELAKRSVDEIHLIDEAAFGELTTYPTITTVGDGAPSGGTKIILRDGTTRRAHLDGSTSWLPRVNGADFSESSLVLGEACLRISCGVATGADGVFVVKDRDLTDSLRPFAHPTVAGRSIALGRGITTTHSILVPYSPSGALLREEELGSLGEFLRHPERRARLLRRTCVSRKPWFAFHENPPLADILAPKILCKDIGPRPWFVVDDQGKIVPRHSVYYLVPTSSARIHELCAYLNSQPASDWLMAHCQRAANGFVRSQSHVLRELPLPEQFQEWPRLPCLGGRARLAREG